MISTNKRYYKQLEKLVNRIEEVTGVNIKNEKSRKRHIVNAKKIYYHVARKNGCEFADISSFIGTDHSTAVFHYNDLPHIIKYDKALFNQYLRVINREETKDRDYFELMIAKHL